MNGEVPVQTDTEYNNIFLFLSGFLRTEEKRRRIMYLLVVPWVYKS